MASRILSLLLVTVTALMAACGDDGKGNEEGPPGTTVVSTLPALTPSPTAQAQGSNCPVAQEVCTFAITVNRAITSSDLASLVASAQPTEYTCPATRPQGLGGPYPLCDNAAPNEKRQGFQVAVLASEGQVVDAAGLRDTIARWIQSGSTGTTSDAYGAGANRLFTVGCAASITACGPQFVLVFSQRQASIPARVELLLYFEKAQASGQPRLVFVALGPLLRPEEEQAALKGGAFQGFLVPQGWPPIQTFYPITP